MPAGVQARWEELAKLSTVLEPVLGPGSAVQHARFARDMAAVYSDMAAVLLEAARQPKQSKQSKQ